MSTVTVTLSSLRELIQEELKLIVEHRLNTNDIVLYHRSKAKLETGDVLDTTHRTRRYGENFELALEQYRQEHCSQLPSRLSCVYASLVPRSRFLSWGTLYAVEPIGSTHVTDSRIIDRMSDKDNPEDKFELIKQYWDGADPTQDNKTDIEVLMSSARVIGSVDEKETRLKKDTLIELTASAPFITVQAPYVPPGLKRVAGMGDFKSVENKFTGSQVSVVIGPGFSGRIVGLYEGEPGTTNWRNPGELSITNSGFPYGFSVTVKNYELLKFMRAFRAGKIVKSA